MIDAMIVKGGGHDKVMYTHRTRLPAELYMSTYLM